MKVDRDTFGPRLRMERERRGIALKNIAESTKIKEHLFAELERGDLSHWPQGIFRRAHLCAYVSAIGLPSQPILAEFLQLFPEATDEPSEHGDIVEAKTAKPAAHPAAHAGALTPSVSNRFWVASFDFALVCLLSSLVAGATGIVIWEALAVVGLGCSAVSSIVFGQSLGSLVQRGMQSRGQSSTPQPISVKAPLREVPSIAPRTIRPSFSPSEMDRDVEIERHRASA